MYIYIYIYVHIYTYTWLYDMMCYCMVCYEMICHNVYIHIHTYIQSISNNINLWCVALASQLVCDFCVAPRKSS